VTPNDVAKAALVLYAAREVGPKGSLEEMKAICYCLRNRARAGWNEGDLFSVIESAGEHAAHDPEGSPIDPASRAFQRLTREIDDIYYGDPIKSEHSNGTLEAGIGEQKFWQFLNRPVRVWFVDNIQNDRENHPSHAQMGLMMFYE
jgi:hypothetical protein